MNMQPPLIELKGLTFAYPGQKEILRGLNFQLRPGERLGLTGPNGSGKTTLLHLIMGLLRPQGGQIVLLGQEVQREKDFAWVRQKFGLLFQNADDQLFSPTVLEDVAFGPLNQGKSPAEAVQIARETLAWLNLEGLAERVTYKLSGGEKKLVALATVLSMQPEVLLLDEPSNALDEDTKERIARILNRLETSYLIVSHDTSFLRRTTEKLYTISQGQILPHRNLFPVRPVLAAPPLSQ